MSAPAPPSARFHAAAAAAIALLCALLYVRSLDAEFVLDDFDNILHNPYVRWSELSLENVWAAVTGPAVRRPVAHLSFGLNHYLGGYAVRGYHVFNLAVHAANALLVYALAVFLLRRLASLPPGAAARLPPERVGWAALLAALCFAAHPLQTQSVVYVVQRMTSLATGFYLASLLLWLRAAEGPGPRLGLRAVAVVCGLLALGSKEIAVTLPLAVLAVQAWFVEDFDRRWLRRRLPWVLALAAGAAVLAVRFAASPRYAELGFDAAQRLLTQTRVAVFYLSLVAWPLPSRLNLLHEIEPSRSLVDPLSTLACSVLLAGLGIFVLLARRRHRMASFALLWFGLQLALESSTLPLRMIFEHRMYLPMVGIAVWAGYAVVAALGARPRLAAAAAVLLLAGLSTATLLRLETWRRWETLWEDVAAKSPTDPLARMQHGSLLARDGQLEAALHEIDAAIRLDPRAARARALRGEVLLALGRPEEALASYTEATRLDPANARIRARSADALLALGRSEEAARALEQALERSPDEIWVWQLGSIREDQGRRPEALALYLRAARMNPGYRQPRIDAGVLLAAEGRYEEAATLFAEALALGADAELHAHLGNALWSAGHAARALAELEAAVRLQPAWLVGVNNLAWMLATAPEPGLRDPERAVQLASDGLERLGAADAGLLDTLAAAHAAAGRFDTAVGLAERAEQVARQRGRPQLAAAIAARRSLYAAGRPFVDADPAQRAGAG